jgi:hypothetical protein
MHGRIVVGVAFVLVSSLACARDPLYPRPLGDVADDRIVGGERIDVEDAPWQVSVQHGEVHRCGGSLVDARWVATAAHCVADVDADVRVAAGITKLSEADHGGILRDVSGFVVHPGYDPDRAPPRHDVALLRLSRAIVVDGGVPETIAPVAPDDVEDGITDPGVDAWVAGWGALGDDGPWPDSLRAVDLEIVGHADASEAYGRTLYADQIAAGPSSGTHASCKGDSGGALVVWDDAGWPRLAGIVSWGGDCDDEELPGVYARVSLAHDWMQDVLADDEPWDEDVWLCEDDEWMCDGSWCIPYEWTCDGWSDCEDETDERAC